MAQYQNFVDNFANMGGFPRLNLNPGDAVQGLNRGLGRGFGNFLWGINPFRNATFQGRRLFQQPSPYPYGRITGSAYGQPSVPPAIGNGFTPTSRATRYGGGL